MTRTLRNVFRPSLLAGLFMPGLVLTACGGKGVSIGSNSSELRNVDPSTVSGSVPACAEKTAHPNVCCKGGPNEASACVAYVNSPFHKCDDGFTLYPDPTTCCDLADPTQCGAPPPLPVPPPTCVYACAPGWWPVLNSPGECCQLVPGQNALQCSQAVWADPTQPPVPLTGCATPVEADAGIGIADAGVIVSDGGMAPDAMPPDPADGGPIDDGAVPPPGPIPPPDCDAGAPVPSPPPPPWPGPICSTPCPIGFAPLAADPSVCCAPQPNGGEICFSQAVGPVGPPTPVGGSGGGSGGTTGGSAPPSNGK